jgi:hypothetical protein
MGINMCLEWKTSSLLSLINGNYKIHIRANENTFLPVNIHLWNGKENSANIPTLTFDNPKN